MLGVKESIIDFSFNNEVWGKKFMLKLCMQQSSVQGQKNSQSCKNSRFYNIFFPDSQTSVDCPANLPWNIHRNQVHVKHEW